MRRILIDNARRKKSLKRGGNWESVSLDDVVVVNDRDGVPAVQAALREEHGTSGGSPWVGRIHPSIDQLHSAG